MKHMLIFILLFQSAFGFACQEGLWRLESGIGEAAIQNMELPPSTDAGLTLESTEGTFDLRLVQASESEDGVTLVGSQQAYLYTLNYQIEAGVMSMPMKITMDGAQGGIQYTFWNDGTVDVGALPEAEGSWAVTAEVMGSSLPFSDEDVPVGPGFVGTYECVGSESLSMALSTPDNDLTYNLVFARVE